MSGKGATLPIESATKDVALVPRSETTAMVEMIERLATNPAVDVEKLERLIALQERTIARSAEEAFNAAFNEMAPHIPEINKRGEILNKNGNVQSRYSKFEDIQRVVKPILHRCGFSMSFETEWPEKNLPRVIGILTHRDGHARRSRFQAQADMSGSKNDVQGLGSTISYGKRYTTIDLLNIVTHDDDDAQSAGRKKAETADPEGYQDWLDNLVAASDEGWEQFKRAWNPESAKGYREHLARTNPRHAETLKIRAQKASKAARS